MICAKETLSCRRKPYRPWREKPDWLDGSTEIELSARHLRAYWDADILDLDDKNKHDTIIERKDAFEVRFRVYLRGRLWKCICGHWCFDVGFTSHRRRPRLRPVRRPARPVGTPDQGLEGLRRAVHREVRHVPPDTIPVEHCGTLYQVGAKFELRCCGGCDDEDSHLAVAGHEPQGEYMFV